MSLLDSLLQTAEQTTGNVVKGAENNPLLKMLFTSPTQPIQNKILTPILAAGAASQNPTVRAVSTSPLADLLSGNTQDLPRATSQTVNDLLSGKTQIAFGGEMESDPTAFASVLENTPKMASKTLDQFNIPAKDLNEYSPQKVEDIKNTLNTQVPGQTWNDKFQNLTAAKQNVWNQIQNAPNTQIPLSDYEEAGAARLKPLVTAGKITAQQAKQYVTSWISRIYNAAVPAEGQPDIQNVRDANGNITIPKTQTPPETIDKNTAIAMHSANNDAASSFFDKTNLSPKDQATLALRNASKDVLNKNVPAVSDLLGHYANIKDAANTVGRLAQDELQNPPPNTLQKILGNPVTKFGIATALGAESPSLFHILGQASSLGLYGAENAAQTLGGLFRPSVNQGNDKQGQQQNGEAGFNQGNGEQQNIHGQSISNNNNNVNSRYSVSNDPFKSGQLMNQDSYNTQQETLQKQIEREKLNNPQQANIDQGKLDALNTEWNGQSQIRDAWTNPVNGVNNVLQWGNQAYNQVQKVDPGFFNALQGGYDSLQKASNGKYAAMGATLQKIQKATGIDFTQYKTRDALTGALDAAMNNYQTAWNTIMQQQTGSQSAQPQTGGLNQILNVPAQAPAQPVQYPKGGFNNTGNVRLNF